MELGNIRLSESIMGYVKPRTGYNFRRRIGERRKNLERDVDRFRFGTIIPPAVVRAEDDKLMDGYCCYRFLLARKIRWTCAYIESLWSEIRFLHLSVANGASFLL